MQLQVPDIAPALLAASLVEEIILHDGERARNRREVNFVGICFFRWWRLRWLRTGWRRVISGRISNGHHGRMKLGEKVGGSDRCRNTGKQHVKTELMVLECCEDCIVDFGLA